MTETEFQVLRAGGFVVAVVLVLTLQRLFRHADLRGSRHVNLPLWALNGALVAGVCGACACTVARWADGSSFGLLNAAAAPLWAALPATILALDLVSYGWHRANHRIAILWRFHRVHHSDPCFTASTAVRFHPGEILLSLPLRLSAVALLGAPAAAVVAFEIAFNVSNLVEHGNVDFPERFERVLAWALVTPALHRRHHSPRFDELDSNFGTIFTFWDRAFATFGPSASRTRFASGLPDGFVPEGLGAAITLPFGPPTRATPPV